MAAATVPVIVDALGSSGPSGLSRCTYFCIDCQVPQPGWVLRLPAGEFPFFLIGLSGIIVSPLGDEFFTEAGQVFRLFEVLEEVHGLLVEVNDIWVPSALVYQTNGERGSAFRMSIETFHVAFEHRSGRMGLSQFLESAGNLKEGWRQSPLESRAFAEWQRAIAARAAESYPKSHELALEHRRPPQKG